MIATKELTKAGKKRLAIVEALVARDGPRCWYCIGELTGESTTLEHLCPKAHGGPEHLSNLVLACKPCNLDARDRSIAEKVKLREKKRSKRGHQPPKE